ncbi:MAG: HypC/HybG/HupF family hydrogenase formation chaperone [Thiotrichaceae bacterium]|uniref:HypC/HybG/HupF family hydrogenase formation chaperone n=1 Tax=Candidatus Thiocaldithrix dubininis TaxID=3080823 RepID=A0AA95KIL5_9GAMM|nr:MAG: HypC/HybG/HupF family hydrogenase formation chaperone [Candidatus Thiocaldithrix dubininis]
MCLGIPGQIIAIVDETNLIAKVEVGGVKRDVNIACIVDEGQPLEHYMGAWVLVHVGFAMSLLDEAEAARTLALLAELGDMQAELDAMQVMDATT